MTKGWCGSPTVWHARGCSSTRSSASAFSHGYHPQHTERLAAYWAEALGGPATFSARDGDESAVVRMHSGNGPHEEMDRLRAIECFDQALVDAGFTDERLVRVLHDYFAWATTTTMARYHDSADDVPDGLSIPHWSWDGFVQDQSGRVEPSDAPTRAPASPRPGGPEPAAGDVATWPFTDEHGTTMSRAANATHTQGRNAAIAASHIVPWRARTRRRLRSS